MTDPSSWNAAGLIYGPASHYIDHLAPLCDLLDIPLFVTEEEEESLTRTFYPPVEVQRVDAIRLPDFFTQEIDIAFVCTPRALFDEIFFFPQKLRGKRVHTIWCPHGNSDKGHLSFFMEGLKHEEAALVYGEKMIDFLKQKNAFAQLKRYVVTGNFRKDYYLRHKTFYDKVVQERFLKKLPPAEKTVLYAPTWNDKESSSSFAAAIEPLIEQLPPHWNLLIKLHPNLLMGNEARIQKLIDKHQERDRALFITDFPPVFPLLSACDLYIGDLSSIGYDFLGFDKPMFFLNQQKRDPKVDAGLYLYQCGTQILPEDYEKIYEIIQKALPKDHVSFSEARKKVHAYTFGPRKSEKTLKEEIESIYSCFPDKDLNFF